MTSMTPCLRLPSRSHSITTATIRYDKVYLRELRRWCDGQLNLAHGTETKKT